MTGARSRSRRSLGQVFFIPAILALTSLVGLVSGLTGDGVRDALSWALLTLPLLAIAIAWRQRTS